ncbi:MAG: hypothetical protein JSS25_00135 [Proteobacteria bacterium]|nr:hypothetical protein [Pseudomonadota bacterium]
MPTYRIDAFQLNIRQSGEVATCTDALQQVIAAGNFSAETGGYIRDFWRVAPQTGPVSFFGQFRKFRQSDLPLVGAPGEEGEELDIAENAGLIEKNFFLVIPAYDVILWQSNQHASSVNHFARLLQELIGTRVTADPIIMPEALQRILAGGLELKKVMLRIARPTNPDLFQGTPFSREILEVLSGGGGDSLFVQSAINGRLATTAQHALTARWTTAARDFIRAGLATSAKVVVIEDGLEYPIDLLADRVNTTVEIDHDGRYPLAAEMLGALKRAWRELSPSVTEILSGGDDALAR